MDIQKSIDRLYKPKLFNSSSVDDILLTREKYLYLLLRDEDNKMMYERFDAQFSIYLDKINRKISKYIKELFDKKTIYIGTSSNQDNSKSVFSRILTHDNVLNGIVVDSSVFDINIKTGETSEVDQCVYAVYFGLIKASVILNKKEIEKDINLHKLITQYIYMIVLKGLGDRIMFTKKSKNFINMSCIYSFYRHFLKYTHAKALSTLKKEFSIFFEDSDLKEYLELMNNVKKYSDIKDIVKILIDINVYHESPQTFYINLLSRKGIGGAGFYSLISSLDQLIGMIVISKYSDVLYNKNVVVNLKIHDSVEDIMLKYVEKLKIQQAKLISDF